jgi:methylenetetrahydrofolate reductase (NADPH)
MRIIDKFSPEKPAFSMEFFVPKTPGGWRTLWRTVENLREFEPTYVSVTYGAMGAQRGPAIETVLQLKHEHGLEAMAHITCVDHTRDELHGLLDQLRDGGVENVIALRGDPRPGQDHFEPLPGGLANATEFIRFIEDEGYPFCIAAAAYPEMHPESADRAFDLANLQAKLAAGASFLVTQLFFDNAFYWDFVRRARAAGISVPIVPGIMPITNVSQIERFTQMCGASIPASLRDLLAGVRDDDAAVTAIGIEWARDQCRALLEGGAPGLHFYTLNRSHSTREILGLLRAEGRV